MRTLLTISFFILCLFRSYSQTSNYNTYPVPFGVIMWDGDYPEYQFNTNPAPTQGQFMINIGALQRWVLTKYGVDQGRDKVVPFYGERNHTPENIIVPKFNNSTGNIDLLSKSVKVRFDKTQEDADQELDYMNDAGINFIAFNYYYNASVNPGMNSPMSLGRMKYINSTHKGNVKACYLWCPPNSDDNFIMSIAQDMMQSWYFRIDGKPVYFTQPEDGNYQSKPLNWTTLDRIRAKYAQLNPQNPNIYTIVMGGSEAPIDDMFYDNNNDFSRKSIIGGTHYSHYDSFQFTDHSYETMRLGENTAYNSWLTRMPDYKYIPSFMTGFNNYFQRADFYNTNNGADMPVGYTSGATNAQLESRMREMKTLAQDNPTKISAILAYAWNEFMENGNVICPTLKSDNTINRDNLDKLKLVLKEGLLSISNIQVAATCTLNNNTAKSVSWSVTGGSGNYSYSFNNSTFINGTSMIWTVNNSTSPINVYVRDNNNFNLTGYFSFNQGTCCSINPPAEISASINPIYEGQSTILTTSCQSGATVKWSTGATGNSITVSPISTTTYSAYCNNGSCSSTSVSKTISIPTCLNLTNVIVPANCTIEGNTKKQIKFDISGGSGTYQIAINSGSYSNIGPSYELWWLPAWGNPVLSVRDANNNSLARTITVTSNACGVAGSYSLNTCGPCSVNPPSTINATANPVVSGQPTTLSTSCQSGATVKWSTGVTANSITVSPTSTSTYSAYCDNGSCSSTSVSKTISVPINCLNLTNVIVPANCTIEGNTKKQIKFDISGGSGTYQVAINSGAYSNIGASYELWWLPAWGNPVLSVRDANNNALARTITVTSNACGVAGSYSMNTCDPCSVNPPSTINATVNPVVSGQPTTLSTSCQSGATVKWSTGATGNSISVSPTSTTTYSAYCENGSCTSTIVSMPITVIPPPNCLNLTNVIVPTNCTVEGNTKKQIKFDISGGSGTYEVAINGGTFSNTGASSEFWWLPEWGNPVFTVRDASNNSKTRSLTVTSNACGVAGSYTINTCGNGARISMEEPIRAILVEIMIRRKSIVIFLILYQRIPFQLKQIFVLKMSLF
ncbi:MAG: hypothetical protein IPO04_15235 [Cytophagaceae bacterium]|nr:hypothetical protein [Cytophagaceae bacterium]